ncbi:hypothetical protein ACLB2K_050649 [Fragaria x ananassa]
MAQQMLTTRMTGISHYRHGASPPMIEISHSSPSHDASPLRSSSSDVARCLTPALVDSSSSLPSCSYYERGTSSKRTRLSPTPSHKGQGKAIPVLASSSPSHSSSSSPSCEKPSESLDSFIWRTHEGIPGYVHRPLSPPPSRPKTMLDTVAALEDVLAQIHMLTSSVNAIKRNIEDRINKAAQK